MRHDVTVAYLSLMGLREIGPLTIGSRVRDTISCIIPPHAVGAISVHLRHETTNRVQLKGYYQNTPHSRNCNSRLLRSHMRLKKNRPYNHWLKSQGHYLLCFSTSRTNGANSVRLRHETRTRYSLKATTKISPHSRK